MTLSSGCLLDDFTLFLFPTLWHHVCLPPRAGPLQAVPLWPAWRRLHSSLWVFLWAVLEVKTPGPWRRRFLAIFFEVGAQLKQNVQRWDWGGPAPSLFSCSWTGYVILEKTRQTLIVPEGFIFSHPHHFYFGHFYNESTFDQVLMYYSLYVPSISIDSVVQ